MRWPQINRTPSTRRTFQTRAAAVALGLVTVVAAHATVFPRLSFLTPPWGTYGADDQHTGMSHYGASSLDQVIWSWDIDPGQPAGTEVLAHYGSPVITRANTVIFPVTTVMDTSYRFEAVNGATGVELWHFDTDYVHGYYDWTPPVEGSIVLRNSYVFPGIGGAVNFVSNADAPQASQPVPTKWYFYGAAAHAANQAWCDANIKITTPIMADGRGNMWFGYYVGDSSAYWNSVTFPSGFPDIGRGGIARLNTAGVGKWVRADNASGDASILFASTACAPALSNDAKSVYCSVTQYFGNAPGYLLKLDAATLATQAKVMPLDPYSGTASGMHLDSSGTPMVGPDGDVFLGTFGRGGYAGDYRESHGLMHHYDANLNEKNVGAFGWDDTATIVPSSLVPQYTGTSNYLILTKYNNYAWSDFWAPGDPSIDYGADGQNLVAVLDPNDNSAFDRQRPTMAVMKPVITVLGITPDASNSLVAGAVREWCINSAAIDTVNKAAIVNSEDGHCYTWDFASNTLQPVSGTNTGIYLNGPIGEAYTPTVIGPDGTVYAINNHKLYAISHF